MGRSSLRRRIGTSGRAVGTSVGMVSCIPHQPPQETASTEAAHPVERIEERKSGMLRIGPHRRWLFSLLLMTLLGSTTYTFGCQQTPGPIPTQDDPAATRTPAPPPTTMRDPSPLATESALPTPPVHVRLENGQEIQLNVPETGGSAAFEANPCRPNPHAGAWLWAQPPDEGYDLHRPGAYPEAKPDAPAA